MRKKQADTRKTAIRAHRIKNGDLVVVSRAKFRELYTAEVLGGQVIRAGAYVFSRDGKCLTGQKGCHVRLPDFNDETGWDEAAELVSEMSSRIRRRRT